MAGLANMVHWGVAVVGGVSFDGGVVVFQRVWDPADPSRTMTGHVVAWLSPGCLVEIDAVAVV